MSQTKKAKTLFEHLSGIKEKKTPWESLSVMDKKSFEPFMVNRFLSMNVELLELVNELQMYTIGQLSPKEVYKLYLDTLPKKKSFDKYIKAKGDDKSLTNRDAVVASIVPIQALVPLRACVRECLQRALEHWSSGKRRNLFEVGSP